MKVYILTDEEDSIMSVWSTKEKAEEENRRHKNEYYLEEYDIDKEHTPIPEEYTLGQIYHVCINKITDEIIREDFTEESKSVFYRNPEYLKIYHGQEPYIQVYSAKSFEHAEELAVKEKIKSYKEIDKDNAHIGMLQSGDVFEIFMEGIGEWKSILLENYMDIYEAYNRVMKSPGKGTRRIKRVCTIILEN